MDLMGSVGKLLAHADEPGTVSEALKELFVMLKDEASKKTPVGQKVMALLTRLENTDDPFYEGMPMMERVQISSLVHSAELMAEVT